MWHSSTTNTNAFEIERKAPGDIDFKKIGTLSIANGAMNDGFTYTDRNAPTGIVQYRVKQLNKPVESAYTNIASVQIGEQFKVQLYPNPAKDVVNISINNPSSKKVYINLFDANGNKLATFNAGIKNSQVLNLPVQQLTAGTYWIEARTEGASQTIQLIIQ